MEFCIEGISKQYKNVVLDRVSFSVSSGECISLVGANGSGKSTLLSILAGVNKADEGSFFVSDPASEGKRTDLLTDGRLRNRLIGYVPQGTPLIEELSAMDNLLLWYSRRDIPESCENGVIGLLGVSEFLDVAVHKMSGGMKKRLSIACAMAGNPSLLLLDEPTAALDLPCREKIYGFFRDFKANGGALLLVTHEPEEITLSDTCYLLKNGQVSVYPYDGDVHTLAERL